MFQFLRFLFNPLLRIVVLLLLVLQAFMFSCNSKKDELRILIPDNPTYQEQLAAKEIRRYLYLRTDVFLSIEKHVPGQAISTKSIILTGKKNFTDFKGQDNFAEIAMDEISGQGYAIHKINNADDVEQLWIIGGEDNGLLFGVYYLLEQYGIGFYLYDDVIPENKIDLELIDITTTRNPLFDLRGILPFHDFPEGPDWWDLDDYKAIISQLPKMGMNFIGFHTYPENHMPGSYKAEPLVWIGLEEDIQPDGRVTSAYPVLHFNTRDTTWGYSPRRTTTFFYGADKLFERDYYGPEYMENISPWPHKKNENIDIFNNSGIFFGQAFRLAKSLGVRTCVGTESSLTVPDELNERLKSAGVDPGDPKTIKLLYKGIFERIKKTYPLDYYWLWTPEYWTWSDVGLEDVHRVKQDIQIAYEALTDAGNPFQLATCGWVLGPPNDRAEFDKDLSKKISFSCINREVGFSPVEPAFNDISERGLWAIPWLEDDPALISPQLWVGRMRKDAFDAHKYGCNGLMGIHWRTINVDPMASALAKAAWEFGPWQHLPRGNRDLESKDFYLEWAGIQFGENVAQETAELFRKLDGGPLFLRDQNERYGHLYRTSDWNKGPGGLRIKRMGKIEMTQRFGFIEELEKIKEKITGKSNAERFNYWLNTFRYARATSELGNTFYEIDSLMSVIINDKEKESKRIITGEVKPLRIRANEEWKAMVTLLLAAVQSKGEMGTIANLQQHNMDYLDLLTQYDAEIQTISGETIPESAMPDQMYSGPDRLIVPTRRGMLEKEEDFRLKVIFLANAAIEEVILHWRFLGEKKFYDKPFNMDIPNHGSLLLGHNTFKGRDFEYYITAKFENGVLLRYPEAKPGSTRSVIVSP